MGTGTVGPMETSLPRPRRLAVSLRAYRRVALASAVLLVVIVGSGATVRLTGSGLGCKHWPGCQPGAFFPDQGHHSDIEFSNRVIASVTIVATLATFLATFLVGGLARWVRWVAGGAFAGTLAQAPLGAITVYYHLNPWLVLTHFLLSMVVLVLGVLVALEAWDIHGDAVPLRLRQLGVLVGVSACVLIVTGTLATAAGPHSGGSKVRRIGTLDSAVWLHVRATAIFAILFFLLVTWLAARRSGHLRGALIVLGLLAVQMVLGEIQFRTKLPWGLVLVHVFLAAIVWAAVVAFVATLWRPSVRPVGGASVG